MADMFKNYAELSAVYTEGVDYKVTLTKKDTKIGISAFHAGGIEIGTSELLQYIYEKRTTWSWYAFEGLMSADNGNLHITSTNFDEPRGLDFASYVERAVSLHGASGDTPITYIGGMDIITREFVRTKLESKGFVVEYADTESGIAGERPDNFVNKPRKGGVQLEMSTQLRKSFFTNNDWSKANRTNKANWTQTMKDYGDAVIEGVELALALKVIGSGQLSLVDLNDAIVSGTAPSNPTVGALWVDESVTPAMLKKWNGTSWDDMGELDPNISETITDIQETLGNMANDDKIDVEERKVIKDKLTEILGYVISDTATSMNSVTTLDASGKGDFYNVRTSARLAGLSTTDLKYVAVATQYNNLKSYLEGLTPIEAWDTRLTNKDVYISVTKSTFRDKWLQYYNAVNDLLTATQEQLKKNVDDINVGGTNYASNGNFEYDITKALWKDNYIGNVVEVVDIGTEEPPHSHALHIKNTSVTNGGIFQPTIFDGKTAEALTGKEITVSYWLKYQNIVAGASEWQAGRFGELIIRGVASDGSYKYTYVRIGSSNSFSYSYVTGTNMTWARYGGTYKVTIPNGAVKVDRVTFKHGIESCTGEFWTTGVQIELGNKITDWKQSPIDLQQRLTNVEFKISDDKIVSVVRSSQSYLSDFSVVNQKIDNIGIGGENLVDGSDFKVRPLMWNGAIPTVIEGTNGQPNSLLVEKAEGGNSYAFSLWGTSKFLKDETYTISFEAKTDGNLSQFNYMYLRGNNVDNYPIPTNIDIDKTNTTDFVRYSVSVKPTYDLPANAGVLIGTIGESAPFEIRKVQVERGDRASDWKRSRTDNENIINASIDSGTMVTNSTFAQWGGTHSKFPTGMTSWGAIVPIRELEITKNGGNALRFSNIGTNDAGANFGSGFFKSNLANAKYIMVELDFYVVSGSLSGAGIVLDWTGQSTYRRVHKLQDLVTETIVTGKWYSGRKVFLRPSDTTTGYTNMSGYLMANYTSIGAKADKDIIFDRLSMREATAEEIKAYSADLTIADMMSDMKVTPIEKSTLKQTWDNIQAEYTDLVAQAQKTAVTYSVYASAYSALNGTTPKISSEILSNMTTTYSFSSTTNRDAFKAKLTNYYNEALRLRRTIGEIATSTRNLILNSTFNQTDEETGNPAQWNNINAKWSVKDPESDKPDSAILYADTTTGNSTNPIYSAHSNWFTVKQGDYITFSLDFKTTSATAWDVKNPFIIEFWDSVPSSSTRVQYQDVSVTALGVSTVSDNTWYRASITVQVTAPTATRGRVRLALFKNGDLFIREVQAQRGIKATDYEYAPEDTSTQIFLLETKVANVQQTIDSGGIVDIVTQSSQYQLDMEGKANAEALGNYATNDALEQGLTNANDYADQKVADIDFSPFVEQTEFSRTADDIVAKISKGGGINMLRNSIGFSGTDFWKPYEPVAGGATYPLLTLQNDELDRLGFSSGFVSYKSSSGQYITQDVTTVIGQTYTFAYYLNKTVDNATNGYAGIDVVDANGTTVRWLGLGTGSGVTDGYERYEYTFVAQTSFYTIRATCGGNAEAIWTGLMFNIGDQPYQWSMHPQEVYNTNIQMDLNGIKVVQLDGGVASGLTVMTPTRFAGYYDVDGNGVVDQSVGSPDEVFRMDKDEFVMKKATVKQEITMGTIKVIEINSNASTGWAFVSNKTS